MQSYNLSKINVLILENNLLIRRLMTGVFHEFGVKKGLSTSNPDAAFEMFTDKTPDIIISDWSPELDGISFIKRIRQAPESPNPYVPIIVCSGNTETQHVLAARDAGMSEYLVKPVSAKSIYTRICSIIEKSQTFVRHGDFFGPDRRRRNVEVMVDLRKVAVTA
ncbi:MAG: response regulator [Alphaproteobacteria bacterium]|jgi:two-component system, chemotaxis family, chemotaxis protein CheY|nr:response regulator [Alphaproteobacteria bacterium]MBT7942969.1 response regulator [Alphaproteobacteria bacterium]